MATIGSMPSMATRDKYGQKSAVIAAIEGLKTALGMTADNAI